MIIDVHCHHLAFCAENGGYIHPKFGTGFRASAYLNTLGILNWREAYLSSRRDRQRIDEKYRQLLVARVEESELDHAVILAFDSVYDSKGLPDYARTPKCVSNKATAALCRASRKLLFGGSVNPYRRDAMDELEYCLQEGAVLIKWLPNVMGFDPADPHNLPFYDRVRQAQIPLLIHIGIEYALPNIDMRFAGLDRLEAVLKTGVTVIAAHCCGGKPFREDYTHFAEMSRLVQEYPNLYLDVSGMAAAHRKPRLLTSIGDAVVQKRLVYGSDYPVPLHPWAFGRELRRAGVKRKDLSRNYFDRDIAIKRACGLPEEAFGRGYTPLMPRLTKPRIVEAL
ncbi:MAG: amidohydrolase family protein [Patescibacteria group bacterium]